MNEVPPQPATTVSEVPPQPAAAVTEVRRTLGLTRHGGGLEEFSSSDPTAIAELLGSYSHRGGNGGGLLEVRVPLRDEV